MPLRHTTGFFMTLLYEGAYQGPVHLRSLVSTSPDVWDSYTVRSGSPWGTDSESSEEVNVEAYGLRFPEVDPAYSPNSCILASIHSCAAALISPAFISVVSMGSPITTRIVPGRIVNS